MARRTFKHAKYLKKLPNIEAPKTYYRILEYLHEEDEYRTLKEIADAIFPPTSWIGRKLAITDQALATLVLAGYVDKHPIRAGFFLIRSDGRTAYLSAKAEMEENNVQGI